MTDNDIIKALECCRIDSSVNDCEKRGCPFIDKSKYECKLCGMGDYVEDTLMDEAVKIIARQKAEIERLEIESASKERAYNDEHLSRKYWKRKAREARAEAIKEFEEYILTLFPSDKDFTTIGRFSVKHKAKEMVGERE